MRQTIQEAPPAKQNNSQIISPDFYKLVWPPPARKSLPMRQKDGKTLLHAEGRAAL